VCIVRSRLLLTLAVPALVVSLGCDANSTTPAPTQPSGPSTNPSTAPPPTTGTNHPPTAQIEDRSPKNSTIVTGGTRFSVKGGGSDPDGDSLTYTWNWGDSSPEDTGKGVSHVYNREGEFRVVLTVSDGRGGKATDDTTIKARKLSGSWRVENARHFDLSININQNNGPGVFGTMSDGAGVQGQVRDPYRVTLTVNAANGFCIPSGTYTGTINPQVTEIIFPGPGCKNFSFFR
jgi:PKD domain